MITKKVQSINNKGINYKVDINKGDCTIYFVTNAPKKITKLLLKLWFRSERDCGEYDEMGGIFKEFGYEFENYNHELKNHIYLKCKELMI